MLIQEEDVGMNVGGDRRAKLTLSIDEQVLKEAKVAAEARRIPLSRLVETYLKFLAETEVYCFSCGEKFRVQEAKVHPACGWLQCPKCNACRCSLDEKTVSAIYQMRRNFEDLLGGKVKP